MPRSVIVRLARASIRERLRRRSFQAALVGMTLLGLQITMGRVSVRLDDWRGVLNSAWAGSANALVGAFFLVLLGFPLVRGSIGDDRDSGVGGLLAASPLSRAGYIGGRVLANFVLLLALTAPLLFTAAAAPWIAGEDPGLRPLQLLAPFLILTLPPLTVVAAGAVLFDTVRPLRGAAGAALHGAVVITLLALADPARSIHPGLEPFGLGLLESSMIEAATAAGGHVFGDGATAPPKLGIDFEPATRSFRWEGVNWTTEVVIVRTLYPAAALLLTLLAVLAFDRFATTPARGAPSPVPAPSDPVAPAVATTPADRRERAWWIALPGGRLLGLELALLLRGQRRAWYVAWFALIGLGLLAPPGVGRSVLAPLAHLWALPLWSSMGHRERRHGIHEVLQVAPNPLWRQLPPRWLAGVLVALLACCGCGARLLLARDLEGVVALGVAALFIPALALTCGLWTGSGRAFEVLYLVLWYLGPVNRSPDFDYCGAVPDGNPGRFLTITALLLLLAGAHTLRRPRVT